MSGVQLSGVRTKQLKTLLGQVLTVPGLDSVQSRRVEIGIVTFGKIHVQRFSQYVNLTPVFPPQGPNAAESSYLTTGVDTGHQSSETLRRLGREERGLLQSALGSRISCFI